MKFTIKTKINTNPTVIYQSWLNSNKHAAMTGGEAKCTVKLGGRFTAWDEYITGRNLALQENVYIKQSWRTVEFEEDQPDSIIEIVLKEIKPNITELTLIHSGLLPKDLKYKQGWKDSYFIPMKAYFEKK